LQARHGRSPHRARVPGDRARPIKTSVDEIEAVLGREDTTAEALAQLREKLNGATDALHSGIDELEPKAHEAEERLKQLGPAPAKDAPPESPEIA
jgi:small-conductance mechanosensitive channel